MMKPLTPWLRLRSSIVSAASLAVLSGMLLAVAGTTGAASEAEEFVANAVVVLVPDPSANLPMATIEEVDEVDLARSRSATPAATGNTEDSGADHVGRDAATDVPVAINAEHFKELMENSPFTRALNLSDSLILTGVARFDGKPMATLMDRETKQTYVISDVPNPQGWKMVDISPGADLETVMAKISVAGGEVVTVRFDESRLKPGEAKPAAGPGHRGGGKPDETDEEREARHKRYAEMRAKMEKMSEEQKNRMREMVEKKVRENPNMSREERGELFRKAMEKASGSGR